jgi:5-methylcytosine-specific restriction endonuclease McrA
MVNVECLHCGKEFQKRSTDIKRSPRHFCSRSCATSNNNKRNPRRTKTKKCSECGELIVSSRKRCPGCIGAAQPKDMTLSEAMYNRHHKSSAFALVRSRARAIAKSQGWKECKKCGYDKHIEIAHIKGIADFPEDTLISVVNATDNLVGLCPNCHWEFDNLN